MDTHPAQHATMQDRLDGIIAHIYDAALDPARWEALLQAIADAVGAVAGFYAGLDIRHGRGAYWHAVGYPPGVTARYNDHYVALDPTLAHITARPGIVCACSDYLSDAEVAASAFHTEFMIPNGIRYVLSGVVSMQGSMVSFFGFQRHLAQAPFGAAEKAFVQRLLPHFAKADQVAAKLSTVSDARRLAMAVLDRMDYAIAIVSQAGQVRMTNQRAEQWLDAGEIMHARFGRIGLADAAANDALGRLIRTAAAGDEGQVHTLAIANAQGGARARILVLPVSRAGQQHLDDDEARAVIVITDHDQQRAMAARVLYDAYKLTAAETRVATGLAAGQTQDELSETLAVSLATIKTHVQHIFQKTGVSRQVELVRLIYGLPALF